MSLRTMLTRWLGGADTTMQEVAARLDATADQLDAAVEELRATLQRAEDRREPGT